LREIDSSSYEAQRLASNKLTQLIQGHGEPFVAGGEPNSKMVGRIEAIAGCEQDPIFGGRLTERPCVLSAHHPGKRRHSAAGTNPTERLTVRRHEAIQVLQVFGRYLLRFSENDIAIAHRDFGEDLTGGIVGYRKVGACVPVSFATLLILLDHPTSSHS